MPSVFNQSIDTSHERRVEQITAECRSQSIELLDVKNIIQYFFQPFSGLTPLPGQHFKVIPGSLKYPILISNSLLALYSGKII